MDLSYHAEIQENKANLNEHSKVKDLREAATKIGVKRVTVMSKKQLCKVQGIESSNKGKYILKNIITGQEYRLKNQKEISDKFGICQGSLSFLSNKRKSQRKRKHVLVEKTLEKFFWKYFKRIFFEKMCWNRIFPKIIQRIGGR